MDNNEKKKILKVEVTGKDKKLWQEMRGKLIIAINKSLDTVINQDTNTTVREEAKEFASALLDHAKSKLKKAGLENEKLLVEIDNLYFKREKDIAEARKINAEAKSIEIQNTVRSLKISLGGMKVIMMGEKGEEDIVFINQINSFIDVLNSLES